MSHIGPSAVGDQFGNVVATGFSALAVLLAFWLPGSPGARSQTPADTPRTTPLTSARSAR